MPKDPMSTFGGLIGACISDRYLSRETKAGLEGFAIFVLGIASSVATTYFLATVGLLV